MSGRGCRRLQPALAVLGCLVPLQPALWLIGDGAGKPAFIEEDVEAVLPEGLAGPDAEEILDFAGLAGLFAELEDRT